MTKQIKQPIANPTHVITTDGTDQESNLGHSTLEVLKDELSLDAVPNLDTTDAVNKAHDQNTDTALDQGGTNEVTAADAREHIDATDNPHNVTATQVGLGDVDNVSAADLRDRTTHTGVQAISTVTGLQSALDDKADKTTTLTAGVGLDGGGDLSDNRTFDLSDAAQASLSAADTALQPGDPATDVSYDGEASGLAATDVQAAIDEVESTKADGPTVNDTTTLFGSRAAGSQIMALTNNVNRLTYLSQQGGMAVDYTVLANEFIKAFDLPVDIDPELAVAIGMNAVGYPVAGGFYAGIIDTIKGDIQTSPADAYQTGLRYALIISPRSLLGLELPVDSEGTEEFISGTDTRWNGLEATNVIINLNDEKYQAHNYIASVRSSSPVIATPGGSDWYMPAMDEAELLYRAFKPNTVDSRLTTDSATFPGSLVNGFNPSADPPTSSYENDPRIPDMTHIVDFQEGNAQSQDIRYWTTTIANDTRFWAVHRSPGGTLWGDFQARPKITSNFSVRPVRRVVL